MELHKSFHQHHHHHHPGLGEEKHQMLDLNRRLETYLSRVKLLEEENALLAKDIQAFRRSDRGASTRRKALEEELRRARLEVDAAWRDRLLTELEIGKLAEELQTLDQMRQREAQAHAEAKAKVERGRRELEEERRAQTWLREKVGQLEYEKEHLIRAHEEDVAHLEATLSQSRAMMPPPPQRSNYMPNLLQMEQEYSQRANRAWQEVAEAHQGQLTRLEESLHEARSRLAQVGQEKSESQLKLRALETEIASAQDVKLHLEKKAAQQEHQYSQEVQNLQEHLEGLEAEREELGREIDGLVQENRGLLQAKMSLGLEVATYRALLDGESLRGDVPTNISIITDAVFSPQGVKRNYQTQLSTSHKTTSLSSVRGLTGRGPTTITTATPIWSRKAVINEASMKPQGNPYPKILQDGAVENFRPQEVHEKVTYAEPLSPPNERETAAETASEDGWSGVGDPVESSLCAEPVLAAAVTQDQFTTPPYHGRVTEETSSFSDELDKDVSFEIPAEREDVPELHDPGKERKVPEHGREETSESETEAVLEPNSESRTSSPVSEYEHEESVVDRGIEENFVKEEAVELMQEISSSTVGASEMDVEDKLYPDGEEMDTWDSVIEKKVDLTRSDDVVKDEKERQHAEPEEDISTREPEHEKMENGPDFATNVQQHDNVASSVKDTQGDEEHAPLPENGEDDEEEDSQNVSVSWRTELEGDSYAQDNTLADTRPLIRYKSDETDAHASHMDESESSEGEQDKKVGEVGSGAWSEGKSKKFGTMEDLCEEVEGDAVDEEYDLGYAHVEDQDVGCVESESESAPQANDTASAEEKIKQVDEGHLDEEIEELTKQVVPADVDYDEELDTDRLVELELENLATESYSTHFAQQQVRDKMLNLQHESFEAMMEQEEAGGRAPEDTSSCGEPEASSEQPFENICFSDSSVMKPHADEEIQDEEQEVPEKREEEDQHNVSMLTHADPTEDHSTFSDFISRPETDENRSEEPNSVSQENRQDETPAPTEVDEVVPVETSTDPSGEHLMEDVAEMGEWEVLKNPSEDFEVGDGADIFPESADKHVYKDGDPTEIFPSSVPDENIFVLKDSMETSHTNGKDSSLFFGSGLKNDFWVSSLETGATNQPDEDGDASNAAAEETNKNEEGFADDLVWGDVGNWKSKLDIDSSSKATEKEQMHVEVKKVLCRNVVEGEMVHSEESEVEGESWSSGEEAV